MLIEKYSLVVLLMYSMHGLYGMVKRKLITYLAAVNTNIYHSWKPSPASNARSAPCSYLGLVLCCATRGTGTSQKYLQLVLLLD